MKEKYVPGVLHPSTLTCLPFIAFVDRLMDVEVAATLKRISIRLSTKWRQTYLRTCGYVKRIISITLVLVTHRYIRASRMPAHPIGLQLLQW